MFFLSLRSEKYGYCPIPRTISAGIIECRLNSASMDVKEIFHKWYSLDSNAVPPLYTLRNLSTISDNDFWNVALPMLRDFMADLPFELDNGDEVSLSELLVNSSVTEWETRYALSKTLGAVDRCKWVYRRFVGGVKRADDPKSLLSDCHDNTIKEKLDGLRDWMTSQLGKESGSGSIVCLDTNVAAYNEEGSEWNQYLTNWENSTISILFNELNDAIAIREHWIRDGCGLALAGHHAEEILHTPPSDLLLLASAVQVRIAVTGSHL